MSDSEVRRADEVGRSQRRLPRLSPRAIAGLVLAALVLVFALLNLQDSNVDFAVDSVTMPLFFVIAATGAIGFGAGYLVARHRERRRRDD